MQLTATPLLREHGRAVAVRDRQPVGDIVCSVVALPVGVGVVVAAGIQKTDRGAGALVIGVGMSQRVVTDKHADEPQSGVGGVEHHRAVVENAITRLEEHPEIDLLQESVAQGARNQRKSEFRSRQMRVKEKRRRRAIIAVRKDTWPRIVRMKSRYVRKSSRGLRSVGSRRSSHC